NIYGGKPFYLSDLKKNYKLKKWDEEKSVIRRAALHAWSISFVDLKGQNLDFEAPYPKDFSVVVNQLEKYS
ncbi:RNA pseudouridine synthase, partial [Bacteroidota bacterium]